MPFSFSLNFQAFAIGNQNAQVKSSPSKDVVDSIEVTLYPQWYKQVTMTWTVPASWAGARYHVYFYPGSEQDAVRLTTAPVTQTYFADTTTRDYSKTQNSYYVVEAILPFTEQVVRSRPATWEYTRRDKIEKIANEIQRREYLLLSKFAGTKSFFFRRKTYGPRCPRCWNPKTEQVMDDHCHVCYGTSFEGGYYDPIPCFVQFEPDSSTKQAAYPGIFEPNSSAGWTISVPQMTSMDVLIRTKDWNVYKIIAVNPTTLQSKIVKQVVNMGQISKFDIENSLINKLQDPLAITYMNSFKTEFNARRFPTNLLDSKPENDYPWAKDQKLSSVPVPPEAPNYGI